MIDYREMPEGATHYNGNLQYSWLKKQDGVVSVLYYWDDGAWWPIPLTNDMDIALRGAIKVTVPPTATQPPTQSIGSQLDTQVGGSHYKDKGIQPVEYNNANQLDFLQGSVVKYVTRHKSKNGAEDIKKAVHFLQFILEFQYGVRSEVKYDEVVNE